MTGASTGTSAADASGSERAAAEPAEASTPNPEVTPEIGGPQGPEPTRYGDWERNGRCSDF